MEAENNKQQVGHLSVADFHAMSLKLIGKLVASLRESQVDRATKAHVLIDQLRVLSNSLAELEVNHSVVCEMLALDATCVACGEENCLHPEGGALAEFGWGNPEFALLAIAAIAMENELTVEMISSKLNQIKFESFAGDHDESTVAAADLLKKDVSSMLERVASKSQAEPTLSDATAYGAFFKDKKGRVH